jgi:hypothetical protein
MIQKMAWWIVCAKLAKPSHHLCQNEWHCAPRFSLQQEMVSQKAPTSSPSLVDPAREGRQDFQQIL